MKTAALERKYTEDGSLNAFIENAIDFYLAYLSANNTGLFLTASVQSCLDEGDLRRRRANRITNVKRTNSRLRFEQIPREADGSDDVWQA